jgi:hypothetical protein
MSLRNIIREQLFATPAGTELDIRNTLFFNILCANPSMAIYYGEFFQQHGANSSLLKDLEARSGILSDPDQSTEDHPLPKEPKGPNSMAISQNVRLCTHIKVNGICCGSPSLRGEVFCYFHQRMIRGVRTPPKSRLHPMAVLEDEQSIQASLMEIINAVIRNQIDINRARLILRALHIAVKNAGNVHFHRSPHEMVSEVPQYPAAPPAIGPFTVAAVQARALIRINVVREEESEQERIDAIFFTAPVDPTRLASRGTTG